MLNVMLSVIILTVIKLNVVMLSVIFLNAVMLNVMLSVIILTVIKLNVIMLIVVAPLLQFRRIFVFVSLKFFSASTTKNVLGRFDKTFESVISTIL
jgi:hypothetical protein